MMFRTMLWMIATLVIAIVAIAIGNERFPEATAEAACTGQASRQLDDTLFTARALSQSGEDPVCTPPQKEDDDSGGMLVSRRHGSRLESLQTGLFGYQPRRR